MELMTKVNIDPAKERITGNNKILMIGSCFADEIGALLKASAFDIVTNPFGTLYNPVSVIQSIERLASGRKFAENDIINTGLHTTHPAITMEKESSRNPSMNDAPGRYCSFFHHSSFAENTPEKFLASANHHLHQASSFFQEADTIIITLGTAWVFRHTARNLIVSNCHKIQPGEFTREFLNVSEITALLHHFIIKYPGKKFIFTVSPIRHLKDGAHGNQISKSTLILAVNELLQKHPEQTSYFPAYEILLDELRDYRFYTEDMVHPTAQAVQYIFERFKEYFISPAEYQKMQVNFKKHKSLMHRPISC